MVYSKNLIKESLDCKFWIEMKRSAHREEVKVLVTQSCLTLCDPLTTQSMEFSRPKYWRGQAFSSPGDLPNSEIEPKSPALQADSFNS